MSAIAPGTFGRGVNQHYKDDEAFLFAIAEALRTEYEAIVQRRLRCCRSTTLAFPTHGTRLGSRNRASLNTAVTRRCASMR